MVFGQDVGTDHDENVPKGALFGSIWERNGARGSVRDAAGPQPLRSPQARIGAGGKADRNSAPWPRCEARFNRGAP